MREAPRQPVHGRSPRDGWPASSEVGNANSAAEFALPTAKAMGHPAPIAIGCGRGVILPVVLLVMVLLAMMGLTFAFSMRADLAGAANAAERLQLRLAAEAGIQYATNLLRTQRGNMEMWYDDFETFRARVVWSSFGERAPDELEELEPGQKVYRFTLVADDPENDGSGLGRGVEDVRYGLTDESSKFNIRLRSGQDPERYRDRVSRLLELVIPTDIDVEIAELVDALIDWQDSDNTAREAGAETEFYETLLPPYFAQNQPLSTAEELLLVRGFTAEILYGDDYNRNGLLDPNEDDGEDTFPPDNGDGRLDRGLLAYITVYSADLNTSNDNRIRVNPQEARAAEKLKDDFTDEELALILAAVRQRAPAGGGNAGRTSRAEDARPTAVAGLQVTGQAGDGGGRGGGGRRGGRGGQGQAGDADAQDGRGGARSRGGRRRRRGDRADLSRALGPGADGPGATPGAGPGATPGAQPGGTRGGGGGAAGGQNAPPLNTPADLFDADGGGSLDLEMLPTMMDRLTFQTPGIPTPGLININTASFEVLSTLPELTDEEVNDIIGRRGSVDSEEKRTTAWLVTTGLMEMGRYQQLVPHITARGQQFTIEAIGHADHLGMQVRIQAVVELNVGKLSQILYYRDLTRLGPSYPLRLDEGGGDFAGRSN